MIISFMNQKGGVGKTTIAINIAASLKRQNNKVIFIDADRQGSAVQWHAVENNKAFEILHHPQPLNRNEVAGFSRDYDYLLIDGPPAISDVTESIINVTQLCVIPLTPSPLDLWSCKHTLEIVEARRSKNPGIEVKLLINRKIPGTKVGHEVRDALGPFNIDVFDTELCQRVAYIEAMVYGVSVMQYAPKSKAADEIERLSREIDLRGVAEAPLEQKQGPYPAALGASNMANPVWPSAT